MADDGSEVKSPIEPEFVEYDVVVPALASVPASLEPVWLVTEYAQDFWPWTGNRRR